MLLVKPPLPTWPVAGRARHARRTGVCRQFALVSAQSSRKRVKYLTTLRAARARGAQRQSKAARSFAWPSHAHLAAVGWVPWFPGRGFLSMRSPTGKDDGLQTRVECCSCVQPSEYPEPTAAWGAGASVRTPVVNILRVLVRRLVRAPALGITGRVSGVKTG